MWMTDQSGVRRVWLALIQQGFQPSRRSIKEEGFDSVGHTIFYHRGRRGSRRRKVHDCMNEPLESLVSEWKSLIWLFSLCSSVSSVVKLVILSV
jgi:hypothetical protein